MTLVSKEATRTLTLLRISSFQWYNIKFQVGENGKYFLIISILRVSNYENGLWTKQEWWNSFGEKAYATESFVLIINNDW